MALFRKLGNMSALLAALKLNAYVTRKFKSEQLCNTFNAIGEFWKMVLPSSADAFSVNCEY